MRPDRLAVFDGSLHFMPILSSLENSPAAQTSSFEFLKISIAFRLRHTGVEGGYLGRTLDCGFLPIFPCRFQPFQLIFA